jgi:hypothetical protein
MPNGYGPNHLVQHTKKTSQIKQKVKYETNKFISYNNIVARENRWGT